MSKGSRDRTKNRDKFNENFDAIFKKKKKQADIQSDNIEMEKLAEEQKYLKELKDKL